jgi:cobalt-zinc-cadmium efflux system outer membrane protein
MLQRTVDATYYAHETARRLREAGNIRELDVLRERALHEQARADLAMAETAAVRLRERMNVLLGLWDDRADAWRLPGRLPEPDADTEPREVVRRSLERSLDLEVRRREILAVGHGLGLRKAQAALPELAGGVAGEVEPDGTLSLGPAVAVSVPIFDQGQAASVRGRAALRRAYRDFTATAVRLRARVRDAYVAMAAARKRAAFFREQVLPVRTRVTAATQRQVNAMQVGVFELLQAKRLEIEAGRRYVETLRDYWLARVELELMVAGRMPRTRFGLAAGVETDTAGAAGAAGGGGGGH